LSIDARSTDLSLCFVAEEIDGRTLLGLTELMVQQLVKPMRKQAIFLEERKKLVVSNES